jgi:hypothetical protein
MRWSDIPKITALKQKHTMKCLLVELISVKSNISLTHLLTTPYRFSLESACKGNLPETDQTEQL